MLQIESNNNGIFFVKFRKYFKLFCSDPFYNLDELKRKKKEEFKKKSDWYLTERRKLYIYFTV